MFLETSRQTSTTIMSLAKGLSITPQMPKDAKVHKKGRTSPLLLNNDNSGYVIFFIDQQPNQVDSAADIFNIDLVGLIQNVG